MRAGDVGVDFVAKAGTGLSVRGTYTEGQGCREGSPGEENCRSRYEVSRR